jgi:hypothetical protein
MQQSQIHAEKQLLHAIDIRLLWGEMYWPLSNFITVIFSGFWGWNVLSGNPGGMGDINSTLINIL